MIEIRIYEILLQMLSFGLLVFLLNKVLVAPLTNFLDKRETLISDDLKEASQNRQESEDLAKEQRSILKQAQQEAKKIRGTAEEAALKERASIMAETEEKAKQTLDSANREIANNFVNAKKVLTAQVGNLAIGLTGKLIQKNLDSSAQENVIQEFVEKRQSS